MKHLTFDIKSMVNCQWSIVRKAGGFTLIELLVAIGIIAAITSFAAVNFNSAQNSTRDSRRKEDLKALHSALVSYFADHSLYPPKTDIGKEVSYSSDSSPDWIPNLAPAYIQKLPKDPKQAGLVSRLARLFFEPAGDQEQPAFPQVAAIQTATFNPVSTGIVQRSDPSGFWPPQGPIKAFDASVPVLEKTYNGSTTFLSVGLAGWDTSSIPDDAVIKNTTLTFTVSQKLDGSGRDLTAEWYNNGWPIDESDWTSIVGNNAHFGTPLSNFAIGRSYTLPLEDFTSNINKQGITALRFHISGGAPKGHSVLIADFNALDLRNPVLEVTYETGGPAPTPPPELFSVEINSDFQKSANLSIVASAQYVFSPGCTFGVVGSIATQIYFRCRSRFPLTQLPPGAKVEKAEFLATVVPRGGSPRAKIGAYGSSGQQDPETAVSAEVLYTTNGEVYIFNTGALSQEGSVTIRLPAPTPTDIENANNVLSDRFSLAINGDGVNVPQELNYAELTNLKLRVFYTLPPAPTPGPSPGPLPTPTPAPAPTGCPNKKDVYCYIVSSDRQSFILWVQLDKNTDSQTFNGPQASCKTAPPPDTDFNYCIESPQ